MFFFFQKKLRKTKIATHIERRSGPSSYEAEGLFQGFVEEGQIVDQQSQHPDFQLDHLQMI